jgi:excisionase family DNA binding protein
MKSYAVAMSTALLQPSQALESRDHIGFRDERYAAAYLGVSVETLRTWRQKKRGPRYRKLGRCVRYSLADLEAFIEATPSGGGRPL